MTFTRLVASCLPAGACALATPSFAQSVKVGLILPMTGPFTSTGKQLVAGARLYMQLKGEYRQEILRSNAPNVDYAASVWLVGLRLQN